MADVVEVQSKLFLPEPGNAEPVKPMEKKPRGRPRKAVIVQSAEKRPRGRPGKAANS
jgi:hypothetical protein